MAKVFGSLAFGTWVLALILGGAAVILGLRRHELGTVWHGAGALAYFAIWFVLIGVLGV